MTKRLILLLLFFTSPLWATTYYVDNCLTVGNDLNNGTSPSTPWLTINKVNTSKFNPGDSILFESTCTWREQLTVPSSGSAGSPITFGAYGTGTVPMISGANLFTNWTLSSGSLYYASYSTAPNQVFEDGARLTQNTVTAASLSAGQWYLDAANSRIWVYLTAGDSPSGHSMEVSQRQYAVTSSNVSYVTLSGLETDKSNYRGVYYNNCNTCTGLLVTGVTALRNFDDGINIGNGLGVVVSYSTAAYNGANGFEVYAAPSILLDHLVAHDNAQLTTQDYTAGIRFTDDPSAQSPNMTVQYSKVYNNGVVGQPDYQGIGIWADTVGNGFTAKYNLVYGNNLIGIMAEADSNVNILYNIVYGTVMRASEDFKAGIALAADNPSYPMSGSLVANNVSYGNAGPGISITADNFAQGCVNNSVENNISVGNGGPQLQVYFGCENPGTNGNGNVYAYNGFGRQATNFIQWGSAVTSYESTYAAWETATGNCGTVGCSHSVQTDPQFANAAASQFWLASGSPAIDAGVNLGSPYNVGLMPGSTWPNSVVTGDQNAYGSRWEIGAFVYVPAIAPPSNLQAVAH
jgi:hypothetical protein